MNNRYRLERWIVVILLALLALPFVGTAEEYYAARMTKATPQREARVALTEDGTPNAIDGEAPAE